MKKQYLIYADESVKKGKYYSNFYGGALVDYKKVQKINSELLNKKMELGLLSEIKWSRVSEQYLNKYIELINTFFEYVRNGDIRIRIMFRQNAYVPQILTNEQKEEEYFLLYYQFIKHSFGIKYSNIHGNDFIVIKLFFDKLPDSKKKNKKFKGFIYSLNEFFNQYNVHIYNDDIVEIDSKEHVILQCMDVILGAMSFKLNDMNKEKNPYTGIRGNRTIAKEKLYRVILYNIRIMYPNFNIGISSGLRHNVYNHWYDSYRHWLFKSKNATFDSKLTKSKNSIIPT